MENLQLLAERIKNMHDDTRAEVIVSDLLAGKVRPQDLVIRFAGQQKRAKRNDIAGVDLVHKKHSRPQVQITLNRDSIYDTLPEGVFHQPEEEGNGLSISAMVEEYRRQQHEERQARQFFVPFENELFLHRSYIESEEFNQLFKIQQARLSRSVLQKLNIDPGLPRSFTSQLLRMLPYASKIAGSRSRTEQLFSLLLQNPVSLTTASFLQKKESEHAAILGQSTLGFDTVAGDSLIPDHSVMQFTVGPISKTELERYTGSGWKSRALQTLINFFVPVEWETEISFDIRKQEAQSFILNDEQSDARLGYTTTLQVA